ncbi:MAG TPA: GcrA family cell cycle regulator [Roseiarcus sp.]|nr:GcrA family cell cycle regulator [Roseiarcus sp.]
MLWTDEAVEALKRLALEGRSASVIAQALGAASRNAVIGKANRIGIKLSGGGRAFAPCAAPIEMYQTQSTATPRRKPTPGKQRSTVDLSRDPRFDPREKAPSSFAEGEVKEMRRVRLAEIRALACRWPLGDPTSGDFAYCGLEAAHGRSYCAGHSRMAYLPPKARTRQVQHERRWSAAFANPWRLR